MHVEAFVLLKPGLHSRVFVCGVVVHDQVQLKIFRNRPVSTLC